MPVVLGINSSPWLWPAGLTRCGPFQLLPAHGIPALTVPDQPGSGPEVAFCLEPLPLYFSRELHQAASFSSFCFQFDCHLLKEASPDHLQKVAPPPPPPRPTLLHYPILLSSQFGPILEITLFMCFCVYSLFHLSGPTPLRAGICHVHAPVQSVEQCWARGQPHCGLNTSSQQLPQKQQPEGPARETSKRGAAGPCTCPPAPSAVCVRPGP